MTTDKQFHANQENAKFSTGPRTDEGKATSSLNGLKHGLTGIMRLLEGEEHDKYLAHCEGIVASLHPGRDIETRLAQAIADDYWRIDRIRHMEQKLLNNAHTLEQGMLQYGRDFSLYSTYESRINRNLRNNMAEFRKLKAERQAEEAVLAKQQVAKPADPAPQPVNGFGFSKPDQPSPVTRETVEARRRELEKLREERRRMAEIDPHDYLNDDQAA